MPKSTIVLAEQGANVMAKAAKSRSRLVSIILHALIAGTLQPYPRIIGIRAFPCKPILCIALSIINATRVRTPESSTTAKRK